MTEFLMLVVGVGIGFYLGTQWNNTRVVWLETYCEKLRKQNRKYYAQLLNIRVGNRIF